ncbi:hypothetical protein AMTRI_Chr06g200990 [Amborella trichopoda]|uniref:Short-chain dehydrogenase/reductase n=1 Tax=Amborella trichopoda TaxID=13333 RepID=U5D3R3_AMBTC|nr:(+)-neomenthol dehydrogenase [Amborella trichopoda]ERN20251.1 hypothetical protein AMTR_s00066p00159430 [Amborella trichopoda]|eukprot:XP_006858784.1 (+)-neomenthol dehydrogenase [Amborella trichopoda]
MASTDPSTQHSCIPTRWWSRDTLAVVTGANKGIGFEIVKQLCELGLTVILTARDESKGLEALELLKAKGLYAVFHCLDVSSSHSILDFVYWLRTCFGGLDILVNNAAVSFNALHENSVEHAETVLRTNFYGPKLLTDALLPLFRQSPSKSRILNVSSRLGSLNKLQDPVLKQVLQDEEKLSEETIDDFVKKFLDQVKLGTWRDAGWPKIWTDYSVSKLALNSYSVVLASRIKDRGVTVNCFCPGFTKTTMTQGEGKYTAEEVARLAVRIALIPGPELPTGKFFVGRKPAFFSKL